MSWLRHEADDPEIGWAQTLAQLQEAGVELPPGLAVVDLRWWQDRILAPGSRVRLPSLAQLAARWGWKKARVQRLLKREDLWSDPYRQEEWAAYRRYDPDTTTRRERDDSDTVDTGSTPTVEESRDDSDTTARRERDESDHRRGDPPSPSPSPPLQQLLALQVETGLPPNDADRASVERELGAGLLPQSLAAIWAEAARPERGIEALRWAVILGPQFSRLRRAALRRCAERRMFQGDYGPPPTPQDSQGLDPPTPLPDEAYLAPDDPLLELVGGFERAVELGYCLPQQPASKASSGGGG